MGPTGWASNGAWAFIGDGLLLDHLQY